MEQKRSDIFGLPFALVMFVLALAVLIDGFIWFFVFNPLNRQLNRVESEVLVTTTHAKTLPTPTVAPSATPSATVAPVFKSSGTVKTVSPTLRK